MEINKTLLTACRAVHIYLTMLGLAVMLLFSVTGLMLNHEDWFGAATPRVAEQEAQVPAELVTRGDTLRVVEQLRQTLAIRGAMRNFADVGDEYAVTFQAPGETWDVSVDKKTGRVTARSERHNFAAFVNNLHRGRYSGAAWSVVIDVSAVLIVLAVATGFVLWLALPRRRQLGIAFLVIGTLATIGVVAMLVPGPDAAIVTTRSGR